MADVVKMVMTAKMAKATKIVQTAKTVAMATTAKTAKMASNKGEQWFLQFFSWATAQFTGTSVLNMCVHEGGLDFLRVGEPGISLHGPDRNTEI